MKLARFIYRNNVPYSLDFSDTFYHDGAQINERMQVYITPAFKLTSTHNVAHLGPIELELNAPQLPSMLKRMDNAAPKIASELKSLAGSNFNAYLKDSAPSSELSGQMPDTIKNASAVLDELGILNEFEDSQQTAIYSGCIKLKILEIGFGFALNFLLAYKQAQIERRRIYYAAVESHYISATDIAAHAQALGIALPRGFMQQYPLRAHGIYRIELKWAVLDLYFGDASDILPTINGSFDAVFFDIFAHQNELNKPLLAECARLCSGQIFSFLANSEFKKALKSAGFKPHFIPADHKREVCASFSKAPVSAHLDAKSVIIIGAGLAGLLTALECKKAGLKTLILESSGVASAGSGNILGQISHAVHSEASALGRFQYLGALASLRAFRALGLKIAPHTLERPANNEAAARFKRCKYPLARSIKGGKLLLAGGTISPKFSAKKLAELFDIRCELVLKISANEQSAVAVCKSGAKYEADAIIIAAGCGSLGVIDAPLSAVRGQVCWIASNQMQGMSERAYITASRGGVAVLGATYERTKEPEGLRMSEADMLLECAQLSRANLLAIKSGWRCYSGDRFPLAGCIKSSLDGALTRVFINTAHGSRGLSTALLGARIVAEQLINMPSSVPQDLARECDPMRFIYRKAKKGIL